MRINTLRSLLIFLLMTAVTPALAQETQPEPLIHLFRFPALGWLLGSGFCAYVISVGVTAYFTHYSSGYPPTVARIACWLAVSLWAIFVILHILGSMLHRALPLWAWIIVICTLLVIGYALLSNRRHVRNAI